MENVIAFAPQSKQQSEEVETPVASYDLLYITQAYNRGEISFNEWMSQSREWAEKILHAQKKAL